MTTTTTNTAPTTELPVPVWDGLRTALDGLGDAPLTEEGVRAHLRPLFSRALSREGLYFASHALGRPLDRAAEDIGRAVDLWYAEMDGAWDGWMEAQQQYRAGVARLIGAPTGEGRPEGCCVVPKTNAGQGLRAVLNAMPVRRPNVVATRGEFDSIDVILKTYQMRDRASVTWVNPDDAGLYHADDIARRITYATDVVMVSHVFCATGQLLEGLERIVRAAHHNHAVVVLDTYLSAGVLPIDLASLDIDYAIGGSSNAVRGGPGACWLMLHPRHSTGERVRRTLDTGWLARKDAKGDTHADVPEFADGGNGWLESTPPFLLPYQANAGLAFLLGVGVRRLRAYGLEQQAYLKQRLGERAVPVVQRTPGGGYLLVPDEDATGLSERLEQDHDVTTDARAGSVRLCPDVLTTREEMDACAERVAEARTL